MKLAFYYHIPLSEVDGKLKLPGYLGAFIDSLASEVEMLYLVMHEGRAADQQDADYFLKQENIRWVNLGAKTPAYHRTVFHKKVLKNKLHQIECCDVFLVRSPSPLSAFFHRYVKKPEVIFMVVGDYVDGYQEMKSKTVRDMLVYLYLLYNDIHFKKRIGKTHLLVNSPALYEKFKGVAKGINLIRTTTLSANSFYVRSDTCLSQPVELLYTGRIDPAKGLFELVRATALLRNKGFNVKLNFVGWEGPGKPVEKGLKDLAEFLAISEYVIFHGKKSVGPELNAMYRMADIYVIPSYHEGFPRTIWEAMANSLPVIATHVGGIPSCLTHEENAILIEPLSDTAIADAVGKIILNPDLRKRLIKSGYLLSKENTLEIQTRKLVDILQQK